jgi:hypothetical protein
VKSPWVGGNEIGVASVRGSVTDTVVVFVGVVVVLLGPVALHLLLPRRGELTEHQDSEAPR